MRSKTRELNAAEQNYRLICTEECQCETGERSVRGRLRDLSGKGVFVRTASPFPVGDRLHLRFRVEGRWIEATGVVRHSELGYGMGIQFLVMQTKDQKFLEAYLSAHLDRLGSVAYSRTRRAPRINHRTLVRIWGKNAEGKRISEKTETIDVSEIGARIALGKPVSRGDLLALQVISDSGGSWAQFRVAWQGRSGTPLEGQAGLEQMFVDFWGIHDLPGG